ncbi:MAG TPA: tRNA 2-thiocytidine biosynthesis protein TtcA [Firmicutes bacterium]|nr:tRNA 2-thiocytidine biosynthesis protein TtcA [Bacillota bacterium]
MQPQLPRKIGRTIWRALMEFSMLGPGDRCLVGLSGGKDSAFLLYALAALRKTAPFEFELAAATIDPMFDTNFPAARLQDLCDGLGVPLFLEQTNLAAAAFAPSTQNPCPRCAYLRRGALNRIAKREGYNRLALAHHHDDAVETLLMSILYAGQIKTFTPVTRQDRSGLLVIRPLIYLREAQIRAARSYFNWEPVPSGCPLDGKSTRQRVKDLLRNLGEENSSIYSNVSAAMRLPLTDIELWPPELSREEMRDKYRQVLPKANWQDI